MTTVETKFKKSKIVCWGLLLTSGILYGSTFSWMKVAMANGANPLGSVYWFVLIASTILGLIICVTNKIKYIDPGFLKICFVWGLISVVIPNLLFFYSAQQLQASLIVIAIALVPILTLTGAILLQREKWTFGRALGISLGACAVALIFLPEVSLPSMGDTFYLLLIFAAAGCYALEHLFIETKIPQNSDLVSLLFLVFSSTTIILTPVVVLTGTFIIPSWPMGAMEISILTIALITLLDYFLITLLILWAGPVFASQAAYIVTVAGIIWGVLIFQDKHSAWIWLAILLLLIGLTLVQPRDVKGSKGQK